MNTQLTDFIEYFKSKMPKYDKEKAQKETINHFRMTKDRKIYYTDCFAVRFCYSKKGTFSNTVLALSQLQKFDGIPFLVVLIRKGEDSSLYLANSSMLKKISHSSKELRRDNIKGSFNGSDIIKQYNDIPNDADHVEELFTIHQGFTWEENVERLVEATSGIKPNKQKFNPDERQLQYISSSVERAKQFVNSNDYRSLKEDLDKRVERNLQSILDASHIGNVNIRGRLIEYLITTENNAIMEDQQNIESELSDFDTKNGLGDYTLMSPKNKIYTDIKSKLMYLNSNPKAYNVDKFLECMSEENSVFLFYFIGINEEGHYKSELCSVYDKKLIEATVLQHHWAGRATRGVAQFKGDTLSKILNDESTDGFRHEINSDNCKTFLDNLLKR